jgi:transposase-like protein
MLGNGHVRFGGRVRETDRAQARHRALTRPNTDLKQRGVRDILICCVDGLKGFPEAIEAVFPQTIVQTCIVRLIRHSLKYVPRRQYDPGRQGPQADLHRHRRRCCRRSARTLRSEMVQAAAAGGQGPAGQLGVRDPVHGRSP